MRAKAIVTDSKYRMSLAVVRSLGRAGISVLCLEDENTPVKDVLAFRSKYAGEKHFVSSAEEDPQRFIDDLLHLSNQGDVVIPVSLASIYAISSNLDKVRGKLGVTLPPFDSLLAADDTGKLLEVAKKVGVPAPFTYSYPDVRAVLNGNSDLMPASASVSRVLRFPVVIKYRRGEGLRLPASERYAIVKDGAAFPHIFKKMSAIQAFPLVQEYVTGVGCGMSALFDQDSRPVAVFCHKRLREYPISGGPSCFAESVWDPVMVDHGLSLLGELKWRGVAMVEFKGDFESGDYKLMEINPRFWGSLPLALMAGVDFPTLLYRVALGERLPTVNPLVPSYSVGVKMRFLFQDVLSFISYLRCKDDKWEFLRGFAKDLLDSRVSDGVFQWDDTEPNFAYVLRAVKQLLKPGSRREI